ncbi:hypothetical protein AIOL_001221 [Candidatus Rhodobacter oscarellae]|uniref:Thymidylate synthase n=1 Tax=Candidatus Rhodobacter oscarellae TaxID=1675527 RepID=A0A0J9E375_9RHOB|nr:hypothetical protein [Candidatus Rhodobacter lobularis]KMW56269.1 hypothetical protein AIOL_001221 [Candidatus Rhodobacter lobularis]
MMALAAVFVFTACDGNPFVATTAPTTPTPTTPTPAAGGIPAAVASDVTQLAFNATAQTLTVELSGLDSTPTTVTTFMRNLAVEAALPAGHLAYTLQEDPLDRAFIAVASQSANGVVRGGVASDGGQFNSFFSGVYYERDGGFDRPASTTSPGTGQVSYAGGYTGLDNWSGPNPPLPPGTNPANQPQAPGRVVGNIFLNVNFDDMLVNGAVFDRVLVDQGGIAHQLPTIVLTATNITADGTFQDGVVEAAVGASTLGIGTYAGLFGGTNATAMAGGLVITEWDPTRENESEHGFWVLNQCGSAGEDATLCTGTAP